MKKLMLLLDKKIHFLFIGLFRVCFLFTQTNLFYSRPFTTATFRVILSDASVLHKKLHKLIVSSVINYHCHFHYAFSRSIALKNIVGVT